MADSDSASDQAYIKGQLQGLRAALRQQGPPPAVARRAATPELRAESPVLVPSAQRAGSPGRRRDEEGSSGGGGVPQPPRIVERQGSGVGSKSDCVLRVEQMQRQREERRRRAEEVKVRRAEEAKEAEGRGGIESVEFLRKIRDYREAHALLKPPEPWGGADVWSDDAGSRIRVCVRRWQKGSNPRDTGPPTLLLAHVGVDVGMGVASACRSVPHRARRCGSGRCCAWRSSGTTSTWSPARPTTRPWSATSPRPRSTWQRYTWLYLPTLTPS